MREFKVVVLGSGGVGKSALTVQFVSSCFMEKYDPTIEDFYRKEIEVDGSPCVLEILDTAGTEQFASMRDLYIKNRQGFLVVYSITNHQTFQDIKTMKEQISRVKGADKVPLLLVGNKIDAVVNAANTFLLGGGGIDGAIHIHTAAGSQLLKECAELSGCSIGQAKITNAYKLPAKKIIHAVGTPNRDPFELANTYKNCFRLMLANSIKSIALPCSSTGIYGYDPVNAAHIAIRETRNFLQENHSQVDRIIFCVFRDDDLKIYEQLLQRYFPEKDPEV